MKRFLKSSFSIFLAITIIFSSAIVGLNEIDLSGLFAVKAEAASTSDLKFKLNSDGKSYYVSSCKESAKGALTIPSTYKSKPVTSIGKRAFECCEKLESVKIPNSITSIGEYAFKYCINIKSITIPESVTSIGEFAFYNSKRLKSIKLPDTLKRIERCAFYNSGYYNNDDNWNNGVLYINNHLIAANSYDPENETDLYVGNVKGAYTIKSGTKNIADYAFYNCTGLTSIKIPKSVTSIGADAFSYCRKLGAVYVDDITAWCDIDFYDNPLSHAGNFYLKGELVTELVIPNNITSIGGGAFAGFATLKSVTIPDSVTSIGAYAFSNCDCLTSITIPDSVTHIGSGALSSCDGFTSITIPDSVTSLGYRAFYNCTRLKSVSIGNGVTSIDDGTFSHCKGLASITIPDNITSIGKNAFEDCDSLISITIPNSVTSIGECAFSNCTSLASVEMSNSTLNIGSSAFSHCKKLTSVFVEDIAAWCGIEFSNKYSNPVYFAKKLYINGELAEDIVISDGVTSVGSYAFAGFTSLPSITIPDSVKRIGDGAFTDCQKLTDVFVDDIATWCGIDFGDYYSNPLSYAKNLYINNELAKDIVISDGVTSVGSYAFYGYENITSVTMSDSVKRIGKDAFCECTNLTSITIPGSVKSIGDYAFSDCASLASVTIGNGVTSIGMRAFCDCESLTSITIPDSVTKIGERAFSGTAYYNNEANRVDGVLYIDNHIIAANVEDRWLYKGCVSGDYVIKSGTKTIGDYAFSGCENLTSIIIPDSIVSIGKCAFQSCESLPSITIPDSVTSIGADAFEYCGSLGAVYITDILAWCNIEFGRESNIFNPDIHYSNPLSYAKNLYINGVLAKDIVIPDGVTSIGMMTFYNCTSLTSITIPDSVTNIGKLAFYNCKKLKSITIPDSVTKIASDAFKDCSGLIIFGTENSYAQKYASKNGFKFEDVNHTHVLTSWKIDKKATVYSDGEKVKKCTECGMVVKTAKIAQLKCSKPSLKSVANRQYGVIITWSKVKGGDSYNVYRKTKNGSYRKIGTTKNAYYTDKTAKSGKRYYYIVKAVNEAGSSVASSAKSVYYLSAPKLRKISNVTGGLKITWGKVSGAEGYYVYRKLYGSKSWTKIATIKKNSTVSYKDKKVSGGKVYVYTVKAYDGRRKSSIDSDGIWLRYLAVPTLKSASSTTKGIKLTWGKVTGAEGYYVYRKTGSGDWKRISTVVGNAKVTYTDKTARKGKTYKYTVKAYKGETFSYYNTKGLTIKDKY